LDAGVIRTVLDAAGSTVEQRDSKGALILRAYDNLNRPIRLWAKDKGGDFSTLRETLVYGDSNDSGSMRDQAAAKNRLGNLFKHYDEAGLLTFEEYDFKGNLLEKVRQVFKDEYVLHGFEGAESRNWGIQPFRVDWQPSEGVLLDDYADSLLDPLSYRISFAYDALNRIKTMYYPENVSGDRKEVSLHHNRAGTLERIELDGEVYIEHISYNAKGQRILIAYGNGIMTRHAYDLETFRPIRLRTESYTTPDPLTYHPTGAPLQDFAYEYDLSGNITALHDRTPHCGIPSSHPNKLDRSFSYDPLYRLLEATGRECDAVPPRPPWDDSFRCEDITRTRAYRETYEYDGVGNMTCLRHNGGSNGFTRTFTTVPNGNRLAEVTIGGTIYYYTYDSNGNLTGETALRHFGWDHSDRMQIYRTQASGSEPSVYAHYFYDSQGNRVKKLIRKQGGRIEATVYIDGIFEYHCVIHGIKKDENNILHLMDDKKRIATVRVGPPLDGDVTPAVKYQFGDHLGSSNVVVNECGSWIKKEEYTPYGGTSFGSFARKRYRFSGKEKDEESALYYFGARYYVPWLGKWASCDPAGMVDGLNSYTYAQNGPLRFVDLSGTQAQESAESSPADIMFQHSRSCVPDVTNVDYAAKGNAKGSLEPQANYDVGATKTDNITRVTESLKTTETVTSAISEGGTVTVPKLGSGGTNYTVSLGAESGTTCLKVTKTQKGITGSTEIQFQSKNFARGSRLLGKAMGGIGLGLSTIRVGTESLESFWEHGGGKRGAAWAAADGSRAVASEAAGLGGFMIGAKLGATTFGTLGAFAGPWGAAIGVVAGSIIGGIAGSYGGSKAVEAIIDVGRSVPISGTISNENNYQGPVPLSSGSLNPFMIQ